MRRNCAAALLVVVGFVAGGCHEEDQTGPDGQSRPAFTTAATCGLPATGLVSWWPGQGSAEDLIDGNDGTLQGGATFATGQVGRAFLLDGIDDFVDLGNAPNLHVSDGDFTVVTWVLFNALSHPPGENLNDAPPGDMSIIDKMSDEDVNGDGWRVIKQEDNRLWFCFGAGSNGCGEEGYTVFSSKVAETGTWYHLAAVKTATDFSIYVNGVQEDTRSLPAFTDTHAANLRIGSYILEGAHLNGEVDEVGIYNRALNPAEIEAIFIDCRFSGFFQPVDNPGPSENVVNRANAGRAIPVKFTLGGNQGLAIFFDGFPKFVSSQCDASDTQVSIEATTTSPPGLSYDPATARYTYVWKTEKAWAGRCGTFQLGLNDGSDHHALFHFTK
jgi:concanavalin A-like lectin/glucanase superfamily protein